ncbi:hypothetical protein AXG93_2318s1220 [Marchantia polymorpha subsp. ruderalis]|uniref:NET domain-containing protein n=1 Tax=Marchantia polymorpha subsp. ruderalis TaxID=1480154 RepID=A0A176VQX8_MARPO|nr:hypothetical protein AXG93_2318s1220 [Marchantia polymorpha subsp. ruderalis]
MNMEKSKLSESLEYLHLDKLECIVQIIKKRKPTLSHIDYEIEIDIDSLDKDTLQLFLMVEVVTENPLKASKGSEALNEYVKVADESEAVASPTGVMDVKEEEKEKERDKDFSRSSCIKQLWKLEY